ncbi:MAG: 4-hydroxy-tetrahydrodipicolinate synthase [Actinomycetota bacterium]|nr:4-hydroxy-tetrahydrodipicolinate synthase [Actinomycetota bacterium]
MRPARFGAVITAMVTPFAPDGSLDVDAAVQLARWLSEHGSEGFVLGGTTGEGPALSDDELYELWRSVTEAVTVPVLAGTGTSNTGHSIELTKRASASGVAGVLVVTPYYSRPSQEGLYAHFEAVAGASELPVVLYDIPVRTGRRIAPSTLLRLAHEVRNVVGVKDATGDPAGAARLLAHAPESFELYSGDDSLTLPLISVGAVGVISVCTHWAGPEMQRMVHAALAGDLDTARRENARLVESYDYESTEQFPNPLPAKAACRALGLRVGQCRLPLGDAPPELEGEALRILTRLEAAPVRSAP